MMDFGKMKDMMNLQRRLKKIQKEIKKQTYPYESPAGTIRVVVNGEGVVQKVEVLKPEFLQESTKKVEKELTRTIQEAQKYALKETERKMQEMLGELDLPL